MEKAGLIFYKTHDHILSYWMALRTCNYRCVYCHVEPKDSDMIKPEIIEKTIDTYNFLETIKPVDLIITGGEPTLLDLPYILGKLKLKNTITIFTNLSKSAEYYNNLNQNFNIKIFTSFHPSQVSVDEYIKKINDLDDIDITIKFMINRNNDLFKAINIRENTKGKYEWYKIIPNEVTPKGDDNLLIVDNLNENINYFYGEELTNAPVLREKSYKDWTCTAQGNSICIDRFGKVYPCKQFYKNDQPFDFNIYENFEENYLKLSKTIICPFKKCSAELELIKYKDIT